MDGDSNLIENGMEKIETSNSELVVGVIQTMWVVQLLVDVFLEGVPIMVMSFMQKIVALSIEINAGVACAQEIISGI